MNKSTSAHLLNSFITKIMMINKSMGLLKNIPAKFLIKIHNVMNLKFLQENGRLRVTLPLIFGIIQTGKANQFGTITRLLESGWLASLRMPIRLDLESVTIFNLITNITHLIHLVVEV